MRMKRKMVVAVSALLTLLVHPFEAQALITAVSKTPSTRNVAANTPAVFPVTWRLTRNGTIGTTVIESRGITVRLINSNGPIVYTSDRTLSKTVNIVNNIEFITFSETITLPRDVVYQATKAGKPLVIQRDFTDDSFNNVFIAEMTVRVGGSAFGDFAITRMDLAFDDGTTACIAKTGKDRKAVATIQASGAGLLRGAWQVREGGGMNAFRTLRTVQAPVNGGGSTTITSPALPTDSAGDQMEVRLVIDSPAISFQAPVLSCGITGKDSNLKHPQDAGKLAKVIEPAPNSLLDEKTSIKWEAVKGAKSYRIEILSQEDGEPITAQMVKPSQTSATLSPLTLDKLDANGRYTVRVVVE